MLYTYGIAKAIISDLTQNPHKYRLNVRNKESPLVITHWHIASYLQEIGIYLTDEELEKVVPHIMMYIHDILESMDYEVEKKRKKLIIKPAGNPTEARTPPKSLKTPAETRFPGGSE